MSETVDPVVGQVWADNDPRSVGRTLRVEKLLNDLCVQMVVLTDRKGCAKSCVGRLVVVGRHRLKASRNGYRLVEEAVSG